MVYDKKNYDKRMAIIKADPKLHEEWKKKQRERFFSKSKSESYKQKARNITKKWRKKQKKVNPNFQEEQNKYHRELYNKQRYECIFHYTNGKMCCSCCGEKEYLFLEIDHLNGGGNKHRKSVTSDKIAAWLIRCKFPKGFGVLCCNCNKGKHLNGGKCPHKS